MFFCWLGILFACAFPKKGPASPTKFENCVFFSNQSLFVGKRVRVAGMAQFSTFSLSGCIGQQCLVFRCLAILWSNKQAPRCLATRRITGRQPREVQPIAAIDDAKRQTTQRFACIHFVPMSLQTLSAPRRVIQQTIVQQRSNALAFTLAPAHCSRVTQGLRNTKRCQRVTTLGTQLIQHSWCFNPSLAIANASLCGRKSRHDNVLQWRNIRKHFENKWHCPTTVRHWAAAIHTTGCKLHTKVTRFRH